ncbi:MAG: zf-HC2 domain-containing protein [Gemmatimonadetes bacterium]|nr:zf-HC2 domain-containing protein [Gemmatimonadota bacterium]
MDAWTDRLSEYVDGDLSADETAALEAHLETCDVCRTLIDELRAVVMTARALPDLPPPTDLWDGILRRIRGAGPVVVAFPNPPARRRVALSLPQLAAAAIAIMMVSGGSVWLALRATTPANDPVVSAAAPAPDAPVVQTVAAVEENYDAAIRELQILLTAMRDRIDPATVQVIERNLAIIDAAIDDARRAIASNPDDLYLYRHLDGTLMKKVDLLRRATSIGRAQT